MMMTFGKTTRAVLEALATSDKSQPQVQTAAGLTYQQAYQCLRKLTDPTLTKPLVWRYPLCRPFTYSLTKVGREAVAGSDLVTRWWASWAADPSSRKYSHWPDNMQVWYGGGYFVALIDLHAGTTAEDVESLLEQQHRPKGFEFRWAEPKDPDWLPGEAYHGAQTFTQRTKRAELQA